MKPFRILAIGFAFVLVGIILLAEVDLAGKLFGALYLFPYGDALVHVLLFGLLSFLINLGFPLRRTSRLRVLVSCLVLAGLVTLEEISQVFLPTRTFSLLDLGANYLGIFGFGEFAAFLRKVTNRNRPQPVHLPPGRG